MSKFNINYWVTEKYLPTRRHRKLRERDVPASMEIEVPELAETDFPVVRVLYVSLMEQRSVCVFQ